MAKSYQLQAVKWVPDCTDFVYCLMQEVVSSYHCYSQLLVWMPACWNQHYSSYRSIGATGTRQTFPYTAPCPQTFFSFTNKHPRLTDLPCCKQSLRLKLKCRCADINQTEGPWRTGGLGDKHQTSSNSDQRAALKGHVDISSRLCLHSLGTLISQLAVYTVSYTSLVIVVKNSPIYKYAQKITSEPSFF